MEPAQVAHVKRAVPALKVGHSAAASSYRYTSDKQCPLCGGRLIRTPRRLQDRLWSMVEPVMRFRCDRFACQWIGNIDGRNAGSRAKRGRRFWLKPHTLLVATLLACAGVFGMALYFATDIFASASVPEAGAPSREWKDLTLRLDAGSAALPRSEQEGSTRSSNAEGRR